MKFLQIYKFFLLKGKDFAESVTLKGKDFVKCVTLKGKITKIRNLRLMVS